MNIPNEILHKVLSNIHNPDIKFIEDTGLCSYFPDVYDNINQRDTELEVFCKVKYNPESIAGLEYIINSAIDETLTSEGVFGLHSLAERYQGVLKAAIHGLKGNYRYLEGLEGILIMLLYLKEYGILVDYIRIFGIPKIDQSIVEGAGVSPDFIYGLAKLPRKDIYTALDMFVSGLTIPLYDILSHTSMEEYKSHVWRTDKSKLWSVFYKPKELYSYEVPDLDNSVLNRYLEKYGRNGWKILKERGYEFDTWPDNPETVPRALALAYVIDSGENRSNYSELTPPDLMDLTLQHGYIR